MTPEGEAPGQTPDTAPTRAADIPAGWYADPNGQGQRYWDGNAWTEQLRSAASPPAPAPQQALQPMQVPAPAPTAAVVGPEANLYSDAVDPNQVLSPEQRELYKQNALTSFPTWVAVVLHIVTFGLFTLIFYLLKHDQLPKVKPDDPSAGKAIGFSFIPFFNIYWAFVAWPRLADRINFQFRLRGQPAPISRGMVITTLVMNLLWILLVPILVTLVLSCILIGQTQGAVNRLAAERGL